MTCESLLKAKRLALHARLVEILESGGDAVPEIVAQHAEAAGLSKKALDYWEQAGADAMAHPAYKEAITHSTAAIRLCREISDHRSSQGRELQLQVRPGQALIAHLGYQAPATRAAFERALELAEDIGEPELVMPSIYRLWASRYVANTPSADLADRLAELTASGTDTGPRCVALRMLALERCHAGHYTPARARRSGARDLRSSRAPRAGAPLWPRSTDAAASYRAWNLWHLGLPDQARNATEQAWNGPTRSITRTRRACADARRGPHQHLAA